MIQTEMGYADTDITPLKNVQTIGFGRPDETSRGVLDKLCAQVSVWKRGEEKCCLITIDHIGFSTGHADNLRRQVGEIIGTDKEKVMLCFSHTHSAPNDSAEVEYAAFADDRIKSAVKAALQNMIFVKAGWGNAYADIGVNRRPECDSLDRRIGILKITDENGKIVMLLLRLTAHANVLKADNYLISSDYFGAVRDKLRKTYGCPVMLTQGASGDVAPKYFKSSINPPDTDDSGLFVRSDDALEKMAEEVSRNAASVIDQMNTEYITNLSIYSSHTMLTSTVPSYERALEVAAEAREKTGIEGTPWLEEVRRLIANGVKTQHEDAEIQYFVLGGGCLCGVSYEIMCDFALNASEKTENDCFYFSGYTNGCTGYFPTEEEYDRGGYEVFWSMLIYYIYYNRVFPLDRDEASKLIKAAADKYKDYINNNRI